MSTRDENRLVRQVIVPKCLYDIDGGRLCVRCGQPVEVDEFGNVIEHDCRPGVQTAHQARRERNIENSPGLGDRLEWGYRTMTASDD